MASAGTVATATRMRDGHRDIKPANILIHEGRPLIADFGVVPAVGAGGGTRLTETGLGVGTPYYMSKDRQNKKPFGAGVDPQSRGIWPGVCYSIGHGLIEVESSRCPT